MFTNVFIRYENQTPINKNYILSEIDGPVLCVDCDNFYLQNIIEDWGESNKIFVFEDNQKKPIFSYIRKDNKKIIY